MLNNILLVAVGGAFGAVARYLFSVSPLKALSSTFPLPTFSVNIIGSFLIGLGMILVTNRFESNEGLKLALFYGFLGSFTTFSAFQYEIYELMRDGNHLNAMFYALASLVVGMLGLFAGIYVAKAI
jgi:fluoride exporter